ncbi:MAG: TrkA C-terminal domain-containing protein, partial [Planctomycetota bacterium]
MTAVLLLLFALIALGLTLGALRVRGVSVGAAGVFFLALVVEILQRAAVAGGFWPASLGEMKLPPVITDLGLVLFVYSVGLQAGPRFFGILRARGAAFLAVGAGTSLVGALLTVLLAGWLALAPHLAAGLYCGATTCTPALAAALDTIRRVAPEDPANPLAADELAMEASVGYGAAYPFSVLAVVVVVQFLPRLLRRSPVAAAAQYEEEQAAEAPPLEKCAFAVTNPNFAGRTIDELQGLHVAEAVISRVKHANEVRPARPETVLYQWDTVLAVGRPEELAKLEAVLGPVVVENLDDPTGKVASEQVVVSQPELIGRTIRELSIWERYGVVITRVRREGLELSPRGDLRLEPGDVLRVVGARQDIPAFADAAGREERRLYETSLIPYTAGLALGAAVGCIPFSLPGTGLELRLGLAG